MAWDTRRDLTICCSQVFSSSTLTFGSSSVVFNVLKFAHDALSHRRLYPGFEELGFQSVAF
ncbi:hypothetical protein BDZ89DRAFT_401167 [Hymenopellis radicata]|nr:hypothetical protein BDZ89DRAFT_401167 [Hymenopellis radicata]